MKIRPVLAVCLFTLVPLFSFAESGPYKLLDATKVGGDGGFDYVYADADGRRLYIPRGNRVTVYDLDTLKPAGEIAGTPSVHGVAVDPQSHHGFSSSQPVVMWDTQTLTPVKTIAVEGSPDGIHFDPATGHILILSHRAPNVTVLDAKDGAIVGTIDLGGAPEQAACDGAGHAYIDLEDKDAVAVVDLRALKVVARYSLGGQGGGPAGLALDAKNRVLFACCREPAVCVVLSADDGKILATLPIGAGTDSAAFNPATLEAFSSQRDGTLTVIKENGPASFAVEQNVATKPGARTSTLDPKTGRIFLITAEFTPPPPLPGNPAEPGVPGTFAPAEAGGQTLGRQQATTGHTGPAAGGNGATPRRGRPQQVPGSFTILTVGR
jgi:DNA-binding beta-propeller fold protein YncE